MKKPLLIFFFVVMILSSVGYAQNYDSSISTGEDGGFIIAEFKEKEFNLGDIFQQQAIIPTYVNAGSVIQFKGELTKITGFTGFLFGVPDKIIVRIYKFDSTKPNFLGEKVNTFTIIIPESVRKSLSNPLTTVIIFDAQMTAPTQIGKYRYEAEPKFGIYRETSIQLDYDTFNVQQGVPKICPLSSVDETFNNIDGGKLKIITTTEYFGLDCTKSTRITYDAICDDGYRESGSGSSTKCELIPETPPIIPPTIGCSANEVCCEFNVYTYNKEKARNDVTQSTQCRLPDKCSWFPDNGKAVENQKCGGSSGGGIAQICGDGTIQSPETCDDGNIINGDSCSNICKLEGVPPSGKIKGIFETLLEKKTRTELEKSSCKQDIDCETGADCVPFSNLPTKTQERLSEGIFNIAEEGICVIPKSDGEGLGDFGNVGDKVADALNIKGENKGILGWVIAIFGVIIGLALINKLFEKK